MTTVSKRELSSSAGGGQSPQRKKCRRELHSPGPHCSSIFSIDAGPSNCLPPRRQSCVLRRIPAGDYVPVTMTTNMDRYYLKMKCDSDDACLVAARMQLRINSQSLLLQSYDDLRLQLEREREVTLLREIAEFENSHTANGDNCDVDLTEDLWVEKYKPSNYLELLSDDGTNRCLLHWLKLWDKVVFGREVKKLVRERTDQNKSSNKGTARTPFISRKVASEVDKELDECNRPMQKVALLCGSPGLGKTTLAHILARQAGYNAVEMNASDDRNPDAFRQQIEAATGMHAVIGTNPLPNCLIIDEIDGAPSSSINVLMSFVSGKPPEPKDSEVKTRRKRTKTFFLKRPVICICNDQFVPALRPLRNLALMLHFPPTASTRLASRLLEIARHECLKVDTSTLLRLCEKADNDIRSCLYTLQFVNCHQKQLLPQDVNSVYIGRKDVQKGLFSIWQTIFTQTSSNRECNSGENTNVAKGSEKTLSTILQLVQSYNDYEKIHLGLFENYLNLKYKDHLLSKASYGVDWLCYSDIVNQEIHHLQNYALMVYLPFASAAFHFTFAVHSHVKVLFPSSHHEFTSKLTKVAHCLEAFVSELLPNVRLFVNNLVLVLDVLPCLLDIISPNLRQVSTQLFSSEEKALLANVIDVMTTCNLTYKQERDFDGLYSYTLDHPVHLIATFPGCDCRKQLSYATKQSIAREVELQKLQKESACNGDDVPLMSGKQAVKEPPAAPKLPFKSITEKPIKDFFGRIISQDQSANSLLSKSVAAGLKKNGVWYHFKEGYSNAVRKNVSIQDLL